MVAYTYRMPAGIPGEINRLWACIVEPMSITPSGTTGAPTVYGVPMVIDNTGGNVGNMRTFSTTDTGASIYGLLARPFPTQSYVFAPALGTSTPPSSGACDILRQGYMLIQLNTGTATAGGQAYVWSAASTGSHVLGGWETTFVSGSTIAIPNCTFKGPADSNGFCEVSFNIV